MQSPEDYWFGASEVDKTLKEAGYLGPEAMPQRTTFTYRHDGWAMVTVEIPVKRDIARQIAEMVSKEHNA